MSMKNSSDTIGNRICDLPACSAVPQPTAPPAACSVRFDYITDTCDPINTTGMSYLKVIEKISSSVCVSVCVYVCVWCVCVCVFVFMGVCVCVVCRCVCVCL
jgi:hypothetical protein